MQTIEDRNERIERQAARIRHLKAEDRNAKNYINLLEDEKAEMQERIAFLEGELKYYKYRDKAEVWF